jgi:DNA-binding IclR family transcriptional regulator
MIFDTNEQNLNNQANKPYSAYRSIEKALEVLGLFTKFPVLTVTEVSKRTGYPKSTISGLLNTLCKYNILEKLETNGFRLGIKTFELGFRYLNGLEMYSVARLWAERLSKEEQEAVHVAIRRGTEVYIIIDVQPPSAYMAILQTGMNIPAHSTALGKVLLAYLPDKELDAFLRLPLQRLTEHTIIAPEKLRDELSNIRKTGFAIDNEESINGLMCISTPIFYKDGEVIAAISISSMELIGKKERIQSLIQKLKLISNNISMDIGYHPVTQKDAKSDVQTRTNYIRNNV